MLADVLTYISATGSSTYNSLPPAPPKYIVLARTVTTSMADQPYGLLGRPVCAAPVRAVERAGAHHKLLQFRDIVTDDSDDDDNGDNDSSTPSNGTDNTSPTRP